MTDNSTIVNHDNCPGQDVLNVLSTKWVPNIIRVAERGPVRFSELVRRIDGANKQSLSVALHQLTDHGFIKKNVVKEKPLHIEYSLSEKGKTAINVFIAISQIPK
jgi:DNA-binding HxlR family transcriptional regulator